MPRTAESGTITAMKKKTSLALTESGVALMKELSKDLGIPQNAVVEVAIRMLAKDPGTRVKPKEKGGARGWQR